MNENEMNGKQKNRWKKWVIILSLLLGSVVVGTGYYVWKMSNTPKFHDELGAKKGMLSNMSEEEIQDLLNQTVNEGYVNIFINQNPVFENGDAPGNIYIQNVPANKFGYRVEIKLKDSDESVLQTGYIKPGYNVENQKLSKKLKKGEYPALAVFTCYENEDDTTPVSQTNVEITLTVQN